MDILLGIFESFVSFIAVVVILFLIAGPQAGRRPYSRHPKSDHRYARRYKYGNKKK